MTILDTLLLAECDLIEGAIYSRRLDTNYSSFHRTVRAHCKDGQWEALILEEGPGGDEAVGNIMTPWSYKLYELKAIPETKSLCECPWNKHPLFCKCN